MESAVTNELLLPFELEGFYWSAYWVFNISLAIICSAGIGLTGWRNPHQLARPAFMMGALAHLIFQWPLAIFSPLFERSLPEHWFFSASVHVFVAASLFWVVATPWLTGRMMKSVGSSPSHDQDISSGSHAILLALFAGLSILYISRVGWQCTGLYAMIFDPELALLARETSGKLLGTGLAGYGYGVLANIICPLVMYTSLYRANAAFTKRQFARVVTWATIGISTLLVVLLPGAKGGLIPTGIVVGVGIVAARGTWMSRIAVAAGVFGAGFLLLSAAEVLLERQVVAGGCYDFGACVSRRDKCSEASTLLESLRHRDMSLGLTGTAINALAKDLHAACSQADRTDESMRCSNRYRVERSSAVPTSLSPPTGSIPSGTSSMPSGSGSMLSRVGEVAYRMGQYNTAIVYRLGVVPLQVAGWHHLYVAEHGSPGIYALPFSTVLFGRRVVMPILVHKAYYHLYSAGDRTSTGTAPTSFFLAYPAYLGVAGIALSLAALFIFDLIACMIIGRLRSVLRLAGIGLMAVGCANFIASDFGTTLLSHGSAAALLLLYALSFTERS